MSEQLFIRRAELLKEMKQIDMQLGAVTKKSPERKALIQRRTGCKNELHRIKDQLKGITRAKNNSPDLDFSQQFVKIAKRELDQETYEDLLEKTALENGNYI